MFGYVVDFFFCLDEFVFVEFFIFEDFQVEELYVVLLWEDQVEGVEDGGVFFCFVWVQEVVDLVGFNFKVKVVEGFNVFVEFDEIFNFYYKLLF